MGNSESNVEFLQQFKELGKENQTEEKTEELIKNLRIFTQGSKLSNVFSIISPDEIRKIIQNNPKSIEKIIIQGIEIIENESTSPEIEKSEILVGCLNILTRILPITMENTSFADHIFWDLKYPRTETTSKEEIHKTSEEEEKEKVVSDDEELSQENCKIKEKAKEESIPLGIVLTQQLITLLFTPKFTLGKLQRPIEAKQPESEEEEAKLNSKDKAKPFLSKSIIWGSGLGIREEDSDYSEYIEKEISDKQVQNRITILRLLLILMSRPLFFTPDHYFHIFDPFPAFILSERFDAFVLLDYGERKEWVRVGLKIIMDSLFNTVFGLRRNNSVLQRSLASYAFQVLCTLLDYKPPVSYQQIKGNAYAVNSLIKYFKQKHANENGNGNVQEELEGERNELKGFDVNTMQIVLSQYDSLPEFTIFYNGFCDLFKMSVQIKDLEMTEEIILLFWRLIYANEKFCSIMEYGYDFIPIVIPILSHIAASLDKPSKVNLLYIAILTLFNLSSKRDFAVQLNAELVNKNDLNLSYIKGNLRIGDGIILLFSTLIISQSQFLKSMTRTLLSLLSNIGPYFMSISKEASAALMDLLKFVSKSEYLLSQKESNQDLFFLLDSISYLICYHYHSNIELCNEIVNSEFDFYFLNHLQFQDLSPHLLKRPQMEAPSETQKDIEENTEEKLKKEKEDEEKQKKKKRTGIRELKSREKKRNTEEEEEKEEEEKAEKGELEESKEQNLNGESKERDNGLIGGSTDNWIADEKWFIDWKEKMPINGILNIIKYLKPKLSLPTTPSEKLAILKQTSIIGVNTPPKIIFIKYTGNPSIEIWLASYLWGVTFIRNQVIPIFDANTIQLFKIRFVSSNSDK